MRRAAAGEEPPREETRQRPTTDRAPDDLGRLPRAVQGQHESRSRLSTEPEAEHGGEAAVSDGERSLSARRASWSTWRQPRRTPAPASLVASPHEWSAATSRPPGSGRRCRSRSARAGWRTRASCSTATSATPFFNRGGRDFESVGLGWLEPRAPDLVRWDSQSPRGRRPSAARFASSGCRPIPGGWAQDGGTPGRPLRQFVTALAERHGTGPRSCLGQLAEALMASGRRAGLVRDPRPGCRSRSPQEAGAPGAAVDAREFTSTP